MDCVSEFSFNEIMLALLIHYCVYIFLVFTAKPQNQVADGLHETIGPCQETTPVYTAFGHVSYHWHCARYTNQTTDFHQYMFTNDFWKIKINLCSTRTCMSAILLKVSKEFMFDDNCPCTITVLHVQLLV